MTLQNMNKVIFDSPTSEEYMEFATPISASCVKCGIPVVPFWKGNKINFWGCGHCGSVVSIDNKKSPSLPLNNSTEDKK